MSLVKRNDQQRVVNYSGGALTANLPFLANQLGKLLASAVKSSNSPANKTPKKNGSSRGKNRAGAGGGSKQTGWSNYGTGGPSKGLSYSSVGTKNRIRVRGSIPISNTAAGLLNSVNYLGFDGGAGGNLLTYANGQDVKFLQAYTYFRPIRGRITLCPTLGTASTGYMAVGYSDNATNSTSLALSDITSCNVSKVGPSWDRLTLEMPINNANVQYFLNDTARDVEHRRSGNIKLFCVNGSPTAVNVVVMDFEVDMWVWM